MASDWARAQQDGVSLASEVRIFRLPAGHGVVRYQPGERPELVGVSQEPVDHTVLATIAQQDHRGASARWIRRGDVVKAEQIAHRFGVSAGRVRHWMREPDFPEPIIGRVFDWREVVAWRQARGLSRRRD